MATPIHRPHRMPRRRAAALAVAALVSLGALTLSACSSDRTTIQPARSAQSGSVSLAASGSAVDAGTFKAAIARPGTVVLDVRTAAEFAEGHLPGAVNIDVTAADFAERIAGLDKSTPYAVYCHSGNRSAVAVRAMTDAGFTDVLHLAGGIAAWTSAGGEVVTG